MVDYDIEYIQNMFANTPNQDIDLDSIFDSHFTSIDTSEKYSGREVFSVSIKLARYLLHNLAHTVPTEREIKNILRFKAHLEHHGMKDSWPKDPITISKRRLTIDKGVKRLYAIALLNPNNCTGVHNPMVLIDEEDLGGDE